MVEAFRKQPLQEVVFLLLHAGLLRSVKVVVLGGGDLVVMIKARINVLSCRILQEDPGKQAFAEEVVKFRIMDENYVVKGGSRTKVLELRTLVCVLLVFICETHLVLSDTVYIN